MATPAPSLATLPDDLLEEIFLRLPTADDLARASSACVSFHRAITDHRFLRRFRALHPPPLLGILCGDLIPAQPPHPSAAIARAFEGFDFSCSFLPNPGRWRDRDVRDGRALFSAVPEGSTYGPRDYSPRDLVTELAVCDPLHRRYVLLPVLPDNLADLVHQPDIVRCDPCLAPPVEEDDNEGTSFRVVCLVRCATKLVVFVFCSCAGQWRPEAVTLDITPYSLQWQHSAQGCFCWKIYESNKFLLLDTHMMDFSAVKLPRGTETLDMAFVETGQRLEMFHLSDKIQHGLYHLFYSVLLRKDGNQRQSKWQTKAVIPLPLNYRYGIYGVARGYLLLTGYPQDQRPEKDYFSLNLHTLQLESFFQTGDYVIIGDVYAGYPPSLSPPTI